ncbi:hypothetical protein B0J14DRAFT_657233 [Halenospora varia]|nr:hypothetical protein B0J14DRAFT_657233 [Halenospora varia]
MHHEDQDNVIEIRPEAHDPTTFPAPTTALRPPSISVNPHHQIRFRHPHYPDSSNVLLTLFAPDTPAGGIEYGVVHAACGVISGNRWNGWFTTKADGPASTLTYGDILCERDYYFHLPESSLEAPYAIVPTFKEWAFPHENLHPCWQANQDHIPFAQSRFATPSSLSAAVFSRDQSCRMSAFAEGTQAAHLCPRSEEAWFQRNEMSRYNLNPLLVATGPIDDTANALLLRQDLHTHFDTHKFVFVPKKRTGEEGIPFVTHLLIASRELGALHHNMRLKPIPDVDIAFLFARFAWTIFTLVAGFLKVGVERRLIGTTISTQPRVPRTLSAADCRKLIPGSKSRSQSPTKRLRRRSDAGVEDEVGDSERHHKRQKKDDHTGVMAYDASYGTEASEEITTPATTEHITVLRDVWLEKERLLSDPGKEWLDEAAWARDIRNDDRVMGPADALRLHKFLGHEERSLELDEEDHAIS